MDTLSLDRKHLWHPYTQALTAPEPLEIARGEGAYLFAPDGTKYLDLISSWWVNLHGHAHPVIAEALAKQAATLEQVIFADFAHAPAATLAARLCERLAAGGAEELTRVFFSDDGSTAVEVALKAAYQYWRNVGHPERNRLVALEGAYHGDTFGAMALGSTSGYFDHFARLMCPVDFLPFVSTFIGDTEIEAREATALAKVDELIAREGAHLAVVIVEPIIQGANGMQVCRPGYIRALCQKLRDTGALVIFDEVMTGFGRTGTFFATEQVGLSPDFVCLSKGLTAGFLPMSATICREAIYQAFLGPTFAQALAHGHSFTANPLGCAVANASLDVFEAERSLEKIALVESIHRERLGALARHPAVTRPRVVGDLAAFEFATTAPGYDAEIGRTLKRFFYDRHLLIRPMGNAVYLLPPYCVTREELDRGYDAIEEAVRLLG